MLNHSLNPTNQDTLHFDLICNSLMANGFAIIDNFLNPAHCEALLHLAQKLFANRLFQEAKIGPKRQEMHHKIIRTDKIFWLDALDENVSTQLYLTKISALKAILNQTFYLGLNEHENHFAIYEPGDFYKKHVDQFQSKNNRKISCVYYLNEHWETHFGGHLKLYDTQDNLLCEVLPENNRFVCFDSTLPHEVALTLQKRFSIAGWMKTRNNIPY